MRYNLFRFYAVAGLFFFSFSLFAVNDAEENTPEDPIVSDSVGETDEYIKSSSETYAMFMYASGLEENYLEEAEKVYLAIVAKDPNAAYVYYKLARVYWRKGNTDKTFEYFEKTIEKDPQIKEAYADYAIVKRISGDSRAAIEIYEKAVKSLDDNLDLYRILSDSYVLEKETQKALDTWMRATREHPKESETWINAINLNLYLKKYADADAIFEEGMAKTNGSYKYLEGARDAYLRNGDYKKADEIGMRLLQIRPTSVRLWIEHINFLLANKDKDGAKKAYAEAKDKLYRRTDFFVEAGTTFEDFADADTALEIYLDGVKTKPNDGNLLLKLASLYEKRGESDKARKYYEKLLKLKPDSPEYYLRIAESQEKDGLYDKALGTYREAAKKFPTSKEVSQKIIMMLIRLGKYEDAEKEFENLAALYPKEHALKIGYIALLNINGKYDRALEIGTKLLDEYPMPELLQEISSSYYGKKDYRKSAEYLEKALVKIEEIQPSVYVRLGTLYRKAGDSVKSKENFDKAIAMLQDEVSTGEEKYKAFYGIASIFEMLGDKPKADEYYQKAIDDIRTEVENSPDDVKLTVTFADFLQKVNKHAEAERYYEIAISKDPQEASALNNLGYMWIEKGEKLDKAIEYVRKALEIEPDNPAYLDSLGWGLFKKKKYEEALIELEKAVEAGADDAVIYDHLGDAFYKVKKYQDATANWGKALELEPENPDEIKAKIEEAGKKLK